MQRPPIAIATPNSVLAWLFIVYLAICSMVVVGGITRLTGSGLSMVDWRPLMGALPPLTEQEWGAVFARYKESPQYEQVNGWMGLADFKRIFFWEYLHRLLGRLIGAIFLVPWLVFLLRRRLNRPLALKLLLAFGVGGLQGLLGWYMVKSGLVDVPAVSHYRLAAHLMLALLLACWILWVLMDELRARRAAVEASHRRHAALAAWSMLALLAVQTVYGAFMAGTRAGYMYTTFPDMHGELIPSNLLLLSPAWRNLFENFTAIHFIHRLLGWATLAAGLGLWVWGRGRFAGSRARRYLDVLLALFAVQFLLGALTVIFSLPVWLATLHQAGGVAALSGALLFAHAVRQPQAIPARLMVRGA